VPNFVSFDAGTLKLQRMIKWDVFLEHGVYSVNDIKVTLWERNTKNYYINKLAIRHTSKGTYGCVAVRRSIQPLDIVGLPGYERLTDAEKQVIW